MVQSDMEFIRICCHPEQQIRPLSVPLIVIVPKKDGGVGIFVDMRAANEAIKCVCHPIPTADDVSFELNGAKYLTNARYIASIPPIRIG